MGVNILKKQLIKLLKEKSVEYGNFTLSSGNKTNMYVDVRRVALLPEGARLISSLILERIGDDVVGIGGPTIGADPIVGAVILLSSLNNRPINGFMIRKNNKKWGKKGHIEGLLNFEKNSRVVIIEDTSTTGNSIIDSIRKIESAELIVEKCISIVDREVGARERIEDLGHKFESIVSLRDLVV